MTASKRLSESEKAQLGKRKILQNGKLSDYSYANEREWPVLREHFLSMSRAAAARYKDGFELPDRMTAYTPGETLSLLEQPEVKAWQRRMKTFTIPRTDEAGRPYEIVAFVPCAKSKPWDTQRVGLYGAYNEVRRAVREGSLPATYFVTVSEPLGVVPEEHWGDFPMYDNPGLFKNESLRASGMMTTDFAEVDGLDGKVIVPFDEEAYRTAISQLGGAIGAFMRHNQKVNPNLVWCSFVEGLESVPSTHSEMLDAAARITGALEKSRRFPKKAATRTRPVEHLTGKLKEIGRGLKQKQRKVVR